VAYCHQTFKKQLQLGTIQNFIILFMNSFPFPSISNAKRRDIFLDLVVVAEPLSDEDERVEHLLGEVRDGGVVLRARPAHLVSY
jgi:hypothetical protein